MVLSGVKLFANPGTLELPLANIYRHDAQPLYQLLDRASAGSGATVLIPDLQRPYVWTPNQVTLLVDSLIRGWPFGTLLLWKVNADQFQGIPNRPFWMVVDRTNDAASGAVVSQMNPPAEYHMVLDGQQRLQSLLLAVGGDSWGFKLEDRDWNEEIKNQRPRGRQSKYPHWSMATLCFDLDAFLKEYQNTGCRFSDIDFRKVLLWAVTDPNGLSTFRKPDNYELPLIKVDAAVNGGRCIRLSRLWKEAQPNNLLKEAQFRNIVKPLLEQHGVEAQKIDALLQPMGELMTTLRDVKMFNVDYLELQPFNDAIWSRASYNDAIVSIFTRLNTAGRTLTREEITFAWLKVGWDSNKTGGQTAGQCFLKLQTEIASLGIDLAMDELVGATSFLWSVFRNGKLLDNSDLLNGEVIRPMASDLANRWTEVSAAITGGVSAIRRRGFEYGNAKHFYSLYALAIPCAWLYIAEQWKKEHNLGVLEGDEFEKKLTASLETHLDRWIICSQWAGRWAHGSETNVANYVKALHQLFDDVIAIPTSTAVHQNLDDHFGKIVEELSTDAANYIATAFPSVRRDRVSTYRNFLWIWHRLEESRWKMSQVHLRIGKPAAEWDVDHTVAFSLWEDRISTGMPTGITDRDEATALVNRIGNCVLLEKNFNISKSKEPIESFLNKVHEFKSGQLAVKDWSIALAVPTEMLNPTGHNVDAIRAAIDMRDKAVRDELAEFARGKKTRTDLTDQKPPVPVAATV